MAEGLKAALLVLGFVLAKEAVDLLKAPTYGPRLRLGEATGKFAAARADSAYWASEQAAADGACRPAKMHFDRGEVYRRLLEGRAARGDETGRDVRPGWRAAKKALRKCREVA